MRFYYLLGMCVVFFILLFFPSQIKAQVLINEFSPKNNPEWVEFFNKNTSETNLDGYYFDDDADFGSDTGNSTKIRLQGLFPSNSLCYLDMNSFLNDGGDTPTLFAPNGDIEDIYTYSGSTAGLSFSRIPDGENWQADTVFSKSSISCISLFTPTPEPTPTSTPTQTAIATSTATATSTPTKTATAQSTPTKTATAKSTPTPSDEPTKESEAKNDINLTETDIKIETLPEGIVAGASTIKKSPILSIFFILSGLGFLGYGGYLIYNKRKNEIA